MSFLRRRDPIPQPIVVEAPSPVLPPTLRLLLTLAAAVIVLAGMHLAYGVLGPIALAAVIVLICHPIRRPLERIGCPRGLATAVVVTVAFAVLAFMVLLLYYTVDAFAGLIIDSYAAIARTTNDTVAWLGELGVQDQVTDAITDILKPGTLLGYVRSLTSAALSLLTGLFFVLAYIIFMAVDGARYSRATRTFGPRVENVMARFTAFAHAVQRYFVVNALFGAIVAVLDGIALKILDVPLPVVWAVLAFVTNFIPNVGFVIGLIPPAFLALVFGDWKLMLIVIVIYCVVNVTLQSIVQPKFVSDAVDITLTLSFVSVVFWTFVIGPLGAILAVPLTLLARALLLEGDPDSWWLRWLSGDDKAAPPVG
ncbi:MAG: AI-2E family transporter [Microbacterium sp.]